MLKAEIEGGDQFIEITISEHQKIGDRISAYMAYRVITKTNMQIFKAKELSVLRRFSDFLGLHDKLTEKYLKIGRIIPPAPEKNVLGNKFPLSFNFSINSVFWIGMTKIKMSNQVENGAGNGNDFVERRRAALERYLNRTAQHPVLVVDPDFREFLECGMYGQIHTNILKKISIN